MPSPNQKPATPPPPPPKKGQLSEDMHYQRGYKEGFDRGSLEKSKELELQNQLLTVALQGMLSQFTTCDHHLQANAMFFAKQILENYKFFDNCDN